MFFINRTASMTRGIYIKKSPIKIKTGDIVVFTINGFRTNLLKYVAATEGTEYCFDLNATLWVDKISVAQKNIQKYQDEIPNECSCYRVKKNQLLVLGDHPDSYDSRYFGPIDLKDVIAQVKLLYAF